MIIEIRNSLPKMLIFLLATQGLGKLNAVEQLWQATVTDLIDAYAGIDGSCAAVTSNKDFVWYSSSGVELHTEIVDIKITVRSFMYISSSLLVAIEQVPLGIDKVIILRHSQSGVTSQVLNGTAAYDSDSSFPYLVTANGDTVTMYRFDEPDGNNSGFSSVPNNSVVVPTSFNGDFEIILESSNDLVNWSPALPGAYDTSTSNRFFRVRAVSD